MSTNLSDLEKACRGALERQALFWSTGMYSGFAARAPGTVGSVVWLVFWWVLLLLGESLGQSLGPAEFMGGIAVVLLTFLALWSIEQTLLVLRRSGDSAEDPGFIVIDEWAGLTVALLGVGPWDPVGLILGFALFRLFDIWKPFPVRKAEELPGAAGVLADDLVAGAIALVCRLLLGGFLLS